MEKTFNEILALNNTLSALSQQRHPFSVGLAKDIKIIEKTLETYNKDREALVDKYAKRDESSKLLGILKPIDPAKKKEQAKRQLEVPNEEVEVDASVPEGMERVVDPKLIDEIEWEDKEKFLEELKVLNEGKIDIILFPIDVTKKFLHTQTGKELTIEDYVNTQLEAGLVLFLSDFGFFANLDI